MSTLRTAVTHGRALRAHPRRAGGARRRTCASGWPRHPLGGPVASRERHVARGKLLPRDRVTRLLDEGSPFIEVAPLAAEGLYGGEAPGAGVIAGIGLVHGRHVMVVCNDATVKGGTYYPLTVKKHLRAQEIALENRLPVHLPRRLRRRVPADAGRGLPGSRPLRPHLLQPGADVGSRRPADRRGARLVHRRRRLRARR